MYRQSPPWFSDFGVPEVVEAGAEHVGQRSERTDVPTQVTAVFGVVAVGLDHHRHGIPAHVGTQALFDLDVAGAAGLFGWLDGVDIAGVGRERHVDAVLAGFLEQLLQQEVGALGALLFNDGGQRLHPFAGFLGIDVPGTTAIESV